MLPLESPKNFKSVICSLCVEAQLSKHQLGNPLIDWIVLSYDNIHILVTRACIVCF